MVKISRNYILGVLAAALAVACALSIYAPIRFDRLRAEREQAVKQRLVKIRYAEERYRKANGTYTDDFGELVKHGYLADSLQYIPFTEGKKFDIAVNTQIGKSGRQIPLMECGVGYEDYLEGLDGTASQTLLKKRTTPDVIQDLK